MRNSTKLVVVACVLKVLALPATASEPRLFDTWVGYDSSNYNTARYMYALAAGDFDNDGDIDVATASYPNIPRVTVLLNQGDASYLQPAIYTLPEACYELIAADITGDGYLDLIAANTNVNWLGNSISLLRNNGDGTFQPARVYPTSGEGPVGLAAADFNQDGRIDVAVANWGYLGRGGTVSLLLNDGAGGLAAAQTFPAGASPFRLVTADLNGDGRPDLAVANGRFNVTNVARVNVLINNGTGGFNLPLELLPFQTGLVFFPTVAAGDVDRDNDIDLVFSHTGQDPGIALFRNLGGGGFAPAEGIPGPPFTGGSVDLAVGDLTGDGWPDIVGPSLENEGWVLVPNLGTGSFGAAIRYPSGEEPMAIELADVDGDSDLDSIVLNRDSLEVCVHLNPGNGDFSPPPRYEIEPFSDFMDHGDIDGDGDLDIVTSGATIRILRNNGDGTFSPSETFRPPTGPLDLKLRDLDGDKDLDILFNERGAPYRWGFARNDGTGHFGNAQVIPVGTCGYFKAEIEAFDLDNDGDLDVAVVENLGCVNIPTSSRRVFVFENLGNATFGLASVVVVNVGPRSLVGGDFNEDGILDIAVTGQPTTIMLGNGDLTFQLVDAAMLPGINIDSADFDGDGHLDLAIAIQRNVAPFIESMAILLGYGDGAFQFPVIYLGSHSPDLAQISEILVADVDRDGDADVLASNYASNDASVWLNNGDGTFQPQVRYGIGLAVLDLSYADFTGDGIGDLAATTGQFPPLGSGVALVTGLGAPPPIPGDLDGDGDVDLADLGICLADFGCTGGNCPGDADGDGDTDLADLGVVLSNFGS